MCFDPINNVWIAGREPPQDSTAGVAAPCRAPQNPQVKSLAGAQTALLLKKSYTQSKKDQTLRNRVCITWRARARQLENTHHKCTDQNVQFSTTYRHAGEQNMGNCRNAYHDGGPIELNITTVVLSGLASQRSVQSLAWANLYICTRRARFTPKHHLYRAWHIRLIS